jgi:SNF2 family DNA or RNA helicase
MLSDKKSEMTLRFEEEIKKLNIDKWLSDENSSKSSRIVAMIDTLSKHPDERCIIFNCFRTNLKATSHYISQDTKRPVFTVKSEDSAPDRTNVISQFEQTHNGILLLTYDLGAEGLNLQQSHVVLLADVWWNDSKVAQAIARVARRGQTNPVSIYIFTSNTGIEKSLYEKHIDKRNVINALMTGKMEGNIRKISMKDIVRLILSGETTDTLADARRLAR